MSGVVFKMADIMYTAKKLREDLEQSEEFMALKTSYINIQSESDVFQMFKKFQNIQIKLQNIQRKGRKPSEEELQQAQKMAQKISQSDLIRQLMDNEKKVNELLKKINNELTSPIQSLYQF